MDPSDEAVIELAMDAMRTAEIGVPAYTHPRSPHLFNQHQLFALLAIRRYLRTDFRAVSRLVQRCAALRGILGLPRAPHYSTLCYAERRLLARGGHGALLREVLERARGTAFRAPPTEMGDFPTTAPGPGAFRGVLGSHRGRTPGRVHEKRRLP